jgi:hypothetical protein
VVDALCSARTHTLPTVNERMNDEFLGSGVEKHTKATTVLGYTIGFYDLTSADSLIPDGELIEEVCLRDKQTLLVT